MPFLLSPGADRPPPLRELNTWRWVAGYAVSLLGDQIWFVALAWAAVGVGTTGQVGLIMAAGSVPRAVLLLAGGAWADRWGVRRTAVVSDLARTVVLMGAAGLLLSDHAGVAVLMTLALLFGAIDAVFLPATAAMPAQLVAADQIVRLNGLRSAVQRLAIVVGAPLGGLLVAAGGSGWAFAAAAVGTALSVVALLLTRVRATPPAQRRRLLAEISAGIGYVTGHPVLRPLLIMAALTDFGFGGAVNVGLPILAAARGWGASGVGTVLGGFGAGAGLSALILFGRGRVRRVGCWFAPLVLLCAGALAGIGWFPSIWVTAVTAGVLGAAAGLLGSLFGSLLLTQTDPPLVARVSAIATLASLGLAPLGYALTGVVAARFGPSAPYALGAAIALTAVVPATWGRVRTAELPQTSARTDPN